MGLRKNKSEYRRPFRDDPNLSRRLKRPVWIITCILCAIILQQGFYTRHQQQEAALRYGLWDGTVFEISDTDLDYLNNLPLIDTVAFQNIEGTVIDQDGKSWGNIGWADPSFYDLANLQLKTGRLPENDKEIVAEASVLDGYGISYEPGQTLLLKIADDQGNIQERSFALSGVLENYSMYWNGEGGLLHFITGSNKSTGKRHLFFTILPGYKNAINKIRLSENAVVQNENRKIAAEPFSSSNSLISLVISLLILLGSFLLLQILFDWEFHHRKEIQLLQILGCRTTLLLKNLGILLISCLVGPVILLGVCLIISGLPFSWMVFLILLYGSLLLIDLLFFLSLLLIHSKDSDKRKRIRIMKSRKSESVTVKEAARRLNRYMEPLSSMKAGLSTLCLTIFLISVNGLYCDWTSLESSSVQDFLLSGENHPTIRFEQDGNSWTNDVWEMIPVEIVEQVENASDLKIILMGRQTLQKVSWPNMNQALFTNPDTGLPDERYPLLARPDENGTPALYRPVLETEYEPMIQVLKESISEGKVDWGNWEEGKEAIVSLPPVVLEESGITPAWNGKQDNSLKVGDILHLKEADGANSDLPVTGIIRNSSILPAYGIFIGGSRINTIQLQLASRSNRIPAELFLSKLASENHLSFNNVAEWTDSRIQSLKMSMILQTALFIFAAAFYLFSLLFIRQLRKDRQKVYVGRMKLAGIPDSIVRNIEAEARKRQSLKTVMILFLIGAFITACIILQVHTAAFPWVQLAISIVLSFVAIALTVYI